MLMIQLRSARDSAGRFNSRAGIRKLRVSDPSSAYELLVFDKHWRLVEPLNEWYRLRKHHGSPRTRQTYLAMLSPFLGYLFEHDYPWNAQPDAIREYTRQYLIDSGCVVVGYLGLLFQTSGGTLISLAATGMVAVLFQPLRERMQRGVNRLLYGQRDEPYAVLSRLGQRLGASLPPEAVLPTIVQTVAEALKLPYAALGFEHEGALEIAAAVGVPGGEPFRLPLTYQGASVGALLLGPRVPGEPFSTADRRLLDDLAHQAGVAVHAVALTAELQRSRERLVLAREEERRRLRRDLHDGLGPVLASLFQRLDSAVGLVERDPKAAGSLLNGLREQVKITLGDLRRLVYALRPPALDELGLVAAIRDQATQHETAQGLRVFVTAPETLPALPAAVGVAAGRLAAEALSDVSRLVLSAACRRSLAARDPPDR